MDKIFNKYSFIESNSLFLYQKLIDFLNTEINDETFSLIYNFIRLENIKSGEFEGNQYLIHKINTRELQVIDIVSEVFVNDITQTRFNTVEMVELFEGIKCK